MPIPQNSNLEFIKVPFSTIREENRSVQMGLVILETDLTIETEFIKFLSQDENIVPKLSLLNTRIPCNDKVTAENLTSMESHFSDSLALFPNKYQFDVVGYGCTSASLLIGDEKIAKIIKSKVQTKNVSTPIAAVKKGLKALGANKIGYLAPYISEIANKMCSHLGEAGFEIINAATFAEDRDSVVGIITPNSILAAIETLVTQSSDLQAIFVSCTSLKCASIIPLAEKKFGVPILSSNSALAWDMALLSEAVVSKKNKGALFEI